MSADKHPAEVLADKMDGPWEGVLLPARLKAAAMLRRIPALEAERDKARQTVRMAHELGTAIAAERDQLRAEVEALRADAERYRWLRMQHEGDKAVSFSVFGPGKIYLLEPAGSMPGELDETIDAARKQQ